MNKFVEKEFKALSKELKEMLTCMDFNGAIATHFAELGTPLTVEQLSALQQAPFYLPKFYSLSVDQVTRNWFDGFVFLKRKTSIEGGDKVDPKSLAPTKPMPMPLSSAENNRENDSE